MTQWYRAAWLQMEECEPRPLEIAVLSRSMEKARNYIKNLALQNGEKIVSSSRRHLKLADGTVIHFFSPKSHSIHGLRIDQLIVDISTISKECKLAAHMYDVLKANFACSLVPDDYLVQYVNMGD
ncbi:hypothetical protein RWV98_05780 [Agathobaculum sp. NTUH-O15-33]|uniref:hypothetical protein n=1 Tax=Agathobaculum sp. NTUH-O15-33 TaxID=3079302 RepID=UPI0029586E5E|nr:hypothetical protein [Agathobaculum sp. NTUH-O15-33]WNX85777.1 hypothetical protein RWV98_05780 [Agathobaculum sp. NTUH-O15-33]